MEFTELMKEAAKYFPPGPEREAWAQRVMDTHPGFKDDAAFLHEPRQAGDTAQTRAADVVPRISRIEKQIADEHAETLAAIVAASGDVKNGLDAVSIAVEHVTTRTTLAIHNCADEIVDTLRIPESRLMTAWRWIVVLLLLIIAAAEVRAQDPQQNGVLVRIQENGVTLIQRGSGPLLTLNCNTNITCSLTGSTITMNASGGGGGGCATVGSAGQILVDDGAGGCTSIAYAEAGVLAAGHYLLFQPQTTSIGYAEIQLTSDFPAGMCVLECQTGINVVARADATAGVANSFSGFYRLSAWEPDGSAVQALWDLSTEGQVNNSGTITDGHFFLWNYRGNRDIFQVYASTRDSFIVSATTDVEIIAALDVDGTLRTPTGAGLTCAVNGRICYDTTANMLHAAQSGADAMVPLFTVTPGSANCVSWVVAGSNYKLGDAGDDCVTAARTISTTSPLGGGGALSANLTLTCTTCLTTTTGAPIGATYITQTADASLTAEQALGALATGCLGSATTTGVVSARTITGTANNITVTNGDCSGNPTLDLGSTAVQTDQANTWTTGAQDMGSATSYKVPTSAGFDPTASGHIGADSTLGAFKIYDTLAANPATVPGILSLQYANTDTLVCSTITTVETNFATKWAIPANFLVTNKGIRLTIGYYATTSGSPPTFLTRVKIGSTVLYASVATAPAANLADDGALTQTIILGTAAAGAAAAVETTGVISGTLGPIGIFSGRNAIAQPVNVATNSGQDLVLSLQCGANTAGNQLSIRQFMAEAIAAP